MAKHKHKKKKSKHDDAADDLFSAAAVSIKQFRKVTNQIAKLSTGQKLVGGATLLAAGLVYLNKLKNDTTGTGFSFHLPQFATAQVVGAEEDEGSGAEEASATHKSRKSAKSGKAGYGTSRRHVARPDADA